MSHETIRLFALNFYEVIVDEAEGRINYHLIEITSKNGFQLFLDVLLKFAPFRKIARIELSLDTHQFF